MANQADPAESAGFEESLTVEVGAQIRWQYLARLKQCPAALKQYLARLKQNRVRTEVGLGRKSVNHQI